MTTAAISSISNPARGLMVYDSVKNQLMVNMGSTTIPIWQTIVFNSGWNLTGNRGTGARRVKQRPATITGKEKLSV